MPYPAAQSDAVAEAMLQCCILLLQRCPVHSGEQLSELLERFVAVASLGKASAAEEVGKSPAAKLHMCFASCCGFTLPT